MANLYHIRKLYDRWLSSLPLPEENQALLDRKFNLEFNYNSNHLEGNTLTYGQTELLLMFGETTGDAKLRDYEEMNAHNVALKLIRQEARNKEKPLTELFIRELNEIILVQPFFKEAVTPAGQDSRIEIKIGTYKSRPNHVITATGETFYYATPEETPAMMADLVRWYNGEAERGDLHPLELAALLHYRYIRIHPFEDGNGRIARLLVNYVLLRNDYPMIVIRSDRKDQYIQALNKSDILTGLTPSDGANATLQQIDPFTEYIADQLEYSLNLCLKAAKGESLDEPDDLDKKLHLLKKELDTPTDGSLKLAYGNEVVAWMTENTLYPLLLAWEERVKSFDPLILDRTAQVSYNRKTLEEKRLDGLIDRIENDPHFKTTYTDHKINVSLSIRGLRNIDHDMRYSGGNISIQFFPHAYEITYSGQVGGPLNKLYHQPLQEEEIKRVIRALGNYLFDRIESIKNKKTR